MTERLFNEMIKCVKNDTFYDFIANEYWQMDKDDLKGIILELVYNLSYELNNNKDQIIQDLKNRFTIE